MKTEKLYENNAYLWDFTATVTDCAPVKGGYEIVLDRTAFFPEEGGQSADVGSLGDVPVLDVRIRDGVLYHKTAVPLNIGSAAVGKVDGETRFVRMQNHTGEHILSGLIHTAFGYNNVGFHLGDGLVTLDVDGVLTAEDVKNAEAEANRVIWENRPVIVSYPTDEELKTMDYRSKLEGLQNIRIVTVEGCDICACCAPHVRRTGEIGLLKVLSFAPYKGGTRIELVCGGYALEDYRLLNDLNTEIMHALSSKRHDTAKQVEKLLSDVAAARSEMKVLKEKLAFAHLTTEEIGNNICAFTKEASYDELRACSNKLLENRAGICFAFSDGANGEYLYTVGGSQNVQSVVKAMNAALRGKGGGRDNFAQGRIAASKEEILSFLRSL